MNSFVQRTKKIITKEKLKNFYFLVDVDFLFVCDILDADGVVEFGFVVPAGRRLDGLSFDLFNAFNAPKEQ